MLTQTVPDRIGTLVQAGGSPFDCAGRRSTNRIRVACKRSAVRARLAPPNPVQTQNSNAEPLSVRPVRGNRHLSRMSSAFVICRRSPVLARHSALVRPDKLHTARSAAAAWFRRGVAAVAIMAVACSAAGHASRRMPRSAGRRVRPSLGLAGPVLVRVGREQGGCAGYGSFVGWCRRLVTGSSDVANPG
jgi:hypothetical protein